MSTDTDTPVMPGPELLEAITAQRDRLTRLRADHEREELAETRTLALLLRQTKDHPDPDVNPTVASRAMGTAKPWAHQMIKALEAGKYDPPTS